ncbi:hypothetical protein BJV77DRAFT_1150514 [Russula vinacea]|nr:hypothetical protein BJV77DRAFT_1150514 [Russula vinacea]
MLFGLLRLCLARVSASGSHLALACHSRQAPSGIFFKFIPSSSSNAGVCRLNYSGKTTSVHDVLRDHPGVITLNLREVFPTTPFKWIQLNVTRWICFPTKHGSWPEWMTNKDSLSVEFS